MGYFDANTIEFLIFLLIFSYERLLLVFVSWDSDYKILPFSSDQ